MSEPTFLVAFAIAAATLLMVAKTVAGAMAGRRASTSEVAQIREQCDRHAAMLDEAHAALATQSAHLAELQERLDFAERLLTQARDGGALGPGEKRG